MAAYTSFIFALLGVGAWRLNRLELLRKICAEAKVHSMVPFFCHVTEGQTSRSELAVMLASVVPSAGMTSAHAQVEEREHTIVILGLAVVVLAVILIYLVCWCFCTGQRVISNYKSGFLRISRLKGIQLKNADRTPGGKSDPFCTLTVDGKFKQKTKALLTNLNPEWLETVTFPVDLHSKLRIEVQDAQQTLREKVFGGASMGYVEFANIRDFMRSPGRTLHWHGPVKDSEGLTEGELSFDTVFTLVDGH
eukprot:CAMPEP_0170599486 /NCGR_PEP_ID=MMETSP0224-20130122/16822_1 /TAXON_ID=285029 /ORGANISM="Togula jolla, Strain CCCM 725" /LENGTH=249 /DNA_ID=CAMNT_0010924139 /DNA_START=23 /DNA_END=772 /DNA_ORIENTATION=-